MEKRLNKTSQINDLIKQTAFGDLMKRSRFNFIIKQSTVFSFWDEIVGKKFSKFARPVAIKNSKIHISAKSPVIVQELSMYKNNLLKKINSYSAPLGLEIKDVVLNYKDFYKKEKTLDGFVEDKPIWLSETQLDKAQPDEGFSRKIEENIEKIKFLNDEQKKLFVKKILSAQKAKFFQE